MELPVPWACACSSPAAGVELTSTCPRRTAGAAATGARQVVVPQKFDPFCFVRRVVRLGIGGAHPAHRPDARLPHRGAAPGPRSPGRRDRTDRRRPVG
ncbi:hypothetical protein OG264_03575 [Streptomyces xanthophaeus]|uniref:hypothetical protein n=1 Tax=Streptomyces xanthophaeus TaxID=67385 RepID=UPI00386C863F|nr:hypothetical protein OG264_03575 [Streptomyces xanthophaeus]WST64357.1 hypothetical protein OG605_34785 [Streptomyces xanthophaeus]